MPYKTKVLIKKVDDATGEIYPAGHDLDTVRVE